MRHRIFRGKISWVFNSTEMYPQRIESLNKTGEGVLVDILPGIVGAVVGLSLYSLLIAPVGAVVVLAAYHAIRGTTRSTIEVHCSGSASTCDV